MCLLDFRSYFMRKLFSPFAEGRRCLAGTGIAGAATAWLKVWQHPEYGGGGGNLSIETSFCFYWNNLLLRVERVTSRVTKKANASLILVKDRKSRR
jgi:hypothetical protein